MIASTTSPGDRCEVCDTNYPLTGTTCVPCLTSHQDQDQDQDYPLSEAVPGPGGSSPSPGGSNEPTELALLVGEWQEGRLRPAEIALGTMPSRAGDMQRAVADHMRLLMGLRLAAGDERSLPYAASMPVRAGIVPDKGTASAAIRALVRMKVVEHVGQLPKTRPGIDGTKLYAPPSRELRAPPAVEPPGLLPVVVGEDARHAEADQRHDVGETHGDTLLVALGGNEAAVVDALINAFDATEIDPSRWAA